MTPKSARYLVVSTWLRVVRGDEITSGPNLRLDSDPVFKQAAYEWLKQAIPNLTSLSMQVFASPEPAVDATMQVVTTRTGKFISLVCGLQIPGPENVDPTGEHIAMIRVTEGVLRRLGEGLRIRQSAPEIDLLSDEISWLQKNGEPEIHIGNRPIAFDDAEQPQPHLAQPKPQFDLWQLFPSDLDDPIAYFRSTFSRMATKQRRKAALSVRWHIDAYMDAFLEASDHGCVTDGEAIHAAALLCGGQETWEQAMADPRAFEDMWPVDDDAEEILAIVNWT